MSDWLRIGIGSAGVLLMSAAAAQAEIRITEYMYSGSPGEFVELTNVGAVAIDLTGWSFDDDSRAPGGFDLSGFGVVQPGESVVFTEAEADAFRSSWNLPAAVKVLGGVSNNLGRNDEINVFDSMGTLVDRLTFGDEDFPGTFRTQDISANPGSLAVLGANSIADWTPSSFGDVYGSRFNGDVSALANPGSFAIPAPGSAVLTAVGMCLLGGRRIIKKGESRRGPRVALNEQEYPMQLAFRIATQARVYAVCGSFAAAAASSGQVVLNELWENPPNGGDTQWEHVELYGPPGFDLTGMAVVLIKDEGPAEIDEAFSLDGVRIGPNGFLVLYATNAFGVSSMTQFFTPAPAGSFDPMLPDAVDNRRWLDAISFAATHIPAPDVVGKLGNDGSSTYLLVRRRPEASIGMAGRSSYGPGYAWHKDADVDVDADSRLDFGDETPAPGASTASVLEPVQIVDELAWSNAGRKEYATPRREAMSNKISQTPGFNPDAASRVRYFGASPMLGGYAIQNDGDLKPRNAADEGWIYGEMRDYAIGSAPTADDILAGAPGYLQYRPEQFDAVFGRNQLNWLAPTDPNGNTYSYAGPGSPNPMVPPFFELSGAVDPNGVLLFEPYSIVGFELTPGTFNDAPAGTALAGTAIGTQFRFVRGDFNFDGVVDCDDKLMIDEAFAAGHTLDDTAMLVRDRNTPDTSDDTTYEGYRWRLESFNGLLAMIRMDLEDGSTGEWTSGQVIDGSTGNIIAWGGMVTAADVAAFDALLAGSGPSCCPADLDGGGVVDVFDLLAYLDLWFSADAAAEMTGDDPASVDVFDLLAYLDLWFAGC